MPASRLIKLIAATLTFAAAGPWGLAAEQLSSSDAPISLKADNTELDFRTGKTLLKNVAISQGEVSVRAERAEATGIDSKDQTWEFSGNVKIVAEKRGTLQSDDALVEIRNNLIIRATANGKPAQFEQRREGSAETEAARGRAKQIVYEVESGTVKFVNDAWLSNGANEISGPLLTYDIRRKKVGGQGVNIVIQPGSKDGTKTLIKPQAAPSEAKP